MSRDYLTQRATFRQLSDVNYDNNYDDLCDFGTIRQQAGNDNWAITLFIGMEWVF